MRTLPSLLILVCAVTACGRRAHDVSDAFRWQEEVEPGSTIHLRTLAGRIDVTPTEGRAARVAGATHWVGRRDPIRFAWRRDGDEIYVCALWSNRGENCEENDRGFAMSGHSWLDMFSLFKRRSTDATASLQLSLPPGVKVDARTMNGAISMVGATAGATARTLNGAINIERSAGPIEAKGTNGSIDVSLDSLGPDDNLVLESVNGSTTAVVPADFEADVRLSTVNGGVQSDFPITTSGEISKHKLRGQIGSSSREVVLKTVNGNVSLLKKEDTPRPDAPAPARARRVRS